MTYLNMFDYGTADFYPTALPPFSYEAMATCGIS
jgi:hypothetical protein